MPPFLIMIMVARGEFWREWKQDVLLIKGVKLKLVEASEVCGQRSFRCSFGTWECLSVP